MQPVSVIIITFNEQRNITRCIQSVRQLADEILVVDSCSTDQTAALAEAEGARVVQHPFEDYVSQRNFSMTLPRNDWVLVV